MNAEDLQIRISTCLSQYLDDCGDDIDTDDMADNVMTVLIQAGLVEDA